MDFLTELYDSGLAYRTINTYRSTLSAYHEQIGETPVGQIPEVKALLSGIDNLRPPVPKYCVIWDVEEVIKYLRQMHEENNLSDKDLTLKCAMLLSLLAVTRCSELHLLDTRFMAEGKDKVIFRFAGKPKHHRKKGTEPEPIEFFASREEPCPVKTIKSYVERTEKWRGELDTKFFISFVKPHKGVTSATIGRWVKTVLAAVGVDVSKFSAHSTRSASSSKASLKGASIRDILKCGNWSPNTSTWQRHYRRPILSSAELLQRSLLEN